MAPEQHAGGDVSIRTDVYALGLVMYELFTGRRAFPVKSAVELARLQRETAPPPPSAAGADLGPDVERTVLACLAPDPRRRPSSVREVIAALSGDRVAEPDRGASAANPETWPAGPYDASGTPGLVSSQSVSVTPSLHQLPPVPADFTGREAELKELRAAVEERGVTISGLQGMGGVGKTTLALKLAEDLAPRYPDAQIYLDLKGVSRRPLTPQQAMGHVIRAYRPAARLPAVDSELAALYRSVLHGRRALLLMDNAAGPEQVEPLIPPRTCFLLVTSRRRFTLPGLVSKSLDILPAAPAAALLRRIVPRIGGRAEEIAGLCGHLPIALRLAGGALAERHDLDPARLARRLTEGRSRLELIDASLTLSYELLAADQRRCWRALSVFPGGFDRAAAAAVCGIDRDHAFEVLGELVRSSLLEWVDGRYRLHDLAHLFAGHRLSDEERFEAERRHADHNLEVLKRAEELYQRGGNDVLRGLRLFDAEWTNIQAGQAWAAAHARESPAIAALCSAFPSAGPAILHLRMQMDPWMSWLESGLAAARSRNDKVAVQKHLSQVGAVYKSSGELRRAIEVHHEALALARETGDRHGEGFNLICLASDYETLGRPRRAVELAEKAVELMREIGDLRNEGHFMRSLGAIHANRGETRHASEIIERAYAIAREIGHRRAEGENLLGFAVLRITRGEPRPGLEYLEQAYAIALEIGHRYAEFEALDNSSWAYVELGEPRRALEAAEQALTVAREMGQPVLLGTAFDGMGRACVALGQPRRAIEYSERAISLGRKFTYPRLEGQALCCLGQACTALGEHSKALRLFEKSLGIARDIRSLRLESESSWEIGLAYERQGDLARAVEAMRVTADYMRSIGHAGAFEHAAFVRELRDRLEARSRPSRTLT